MIRYHVVEPNPPRGKRRAPARRSASSAKRPSAAQVAARKLFAQRARSGAFKNMTRKRMARLVGKKRGYALSKPGGWQTTTSEYRLSRRAEDLPDFVRQFTRGRNAASKRRPRVNAPRRTVRRLLPALRLPVVRRNGRGSSRRACMTCGTSATLVGSKCPACYFGSRARKNPSKRFRVGQRVEKTMGVQQSGVVIGRIPKSKYTDGQYREPEGRENSRAVYVRWDDGTQGWLHDVHVGPVGSNDWKKRKHTNPRGRSANNNPRRKQMASAKQIAWRRKFAAMARAGTLRKGSRRNPRGRPLSSKIYRPRLRRGGKGTIGSVAARHYRSALKTHTSQVRRGHPKHKKAWANRARRPMSALQRKYFGPRRVRKVPHRRKAARNPGGMSYNRTRKSRKIRRSAFRRPVRRHARRGGFRNPGIVATLKGANPFSMSKAKQVGAGILGAVGVMTLARFIPASFVGMVPQVLLPIVPFALAGLVAGIAARFLPSMGTAILVGGSTAAGVALVGQYLPSALSIGMSPQQKAGFLQLPRGARLQGFLNTPRGTRLAGLGALQVQGPRMGALQIPAVSGSKMAGLHSSSWTKVSKSF